jgi:glucose-6-phosphate isomerase
MKNKQLVFDYTYLLKESVGDQHALSLDDVYAYKERTREYDTVLKADRKNGAIGFYDLPFDRRTVREIKAYANKHVHAFDNFVVLGIGGSALGNIALQNAINHPYYNLLSKKPRKGYPRIFILDNIDPEYVMQFLDIITPHRTLFNVISKSGSTAETSAQFLIIADLLRKKLGDRLDKNVVITTDKDKGDLRKIADDYNIHSFEIPHNVGGRFSVLSSVGLLTAAFARINIDKLLLGAADMLKRCESPELSENPAYLNAIFHYLMDTQKGKMISVMMSYSNALYYWADWYRQLWAESLGKNVDVQGNPVSVGQTPVKALGVTDQHSQVQLYTEGPNDKVFTLLTVGKYRKDIKLPKFQGHYSSLEYLSGNTLSKLFDAEMRATEFALAQRQRPSCKIIFPQIDEYTVGQFIMMYEIQTAFAGRLYNIDAFDQPGVEAGKRATYGLLGRSGFEDEAKKILEQESSRAFI